jgi:hypothetical protein
MIDFQAGSIRIFEQDRIIAGRIIVLLRRMHDVRADIFEKAMGLIDLAAFTGTETDVMQTDVSLDETLALRSLRRSFDAETGSPADAIVDAGRVRDDFQSQEWQQFAIEGARQIEVSSSDEDVRDAVDFHRMRPWSRLSVQTIADVLSRLVGEEKGCKNPRRHDARLQQ